MRRDLQMQMLFPLLILQCGLLASAAIDPVDFVALQSVRDALHDLPGSTFFSAWDFTSDPCDFPGVSCAAAKVVALNLGDQRAGSRGLAGRIHPAIATLSSLAEFSVVPGRITGALPPSISRLKSLAFLGISRNLISGRIPADIGQLRRLQTLDLSYNRLTGPIPPSVGTLPALANLVLCRNRLSGPVPAFASKALTRLVLNRNQLSGSMPANPLPSSLQYLSLSWNRLSGPVDLALSRLDRLSYLDLSMNHFTGGIPGRIFGLPITTLQLQRNAFSGEVRPSSGRVSIQTVDLSHNRLGGEISPLLASVRNLYLNDNRFTGRVPVGFVDRLLDAGMQTLYLQRNYLTGIEIDPTAEIPATTTVCLQFNCMVPPVQATCPSKAGKRKTRPTAQCAQWKG